MNRGGKADLPVLRILLAIHKKVLKAKFSKSDELFSFVGICKFGSFKTFLWQLLACLNFTLDSEYPFTWYKKKKISSSSFFLVSTNYASSTRSWNTWSWMKLDLIFTLRDIFINSSLNPLRKFTSSNRSTEFKDILLSLKWSQRLSQSEE